MYQKMFLFKNVLCSDGRRWVIFLQVRSGSSWRVHVSVKYTNNQRMKHYRKIAWERKNAIGNQNCLKTFGKGARRKSPSPGRSTLSGSAIPLFLLACKTKRTFFQQAFSIVAFVASAVLHCLCTCRDQMYRRHRSRTRSHTSQSRDHPFLQI